MPRAPLPGPYGWRWAKPRLLLLAAGPAPAQTPGTGSFIPNPAAAPLDSGASLLLATGVAYGLKYLRCRKR